MNEQFPSKVNQQVEKLKKYSLGDIEAEVTCKRLEWLDRRYPAGNDPAIHSPRQAFELLFFDYMGIDEKDLPVIEESPDLIIWRSGNPCPTLEACLLLGMDTRIVCRDAYERSTQAFLSRLDPRLHFHRSYSEIRPYSVYCLERIVKVDA